MNRFNISTHLDKSKKQDDNLAVRQLHNGIVIGSVCDGVSRCHDGSIASKAGTTVMLDFIELALYSTWILNTMDYYGVLNNAKRHTDQFLENFTKAISIGNAPKVKKYIKHLKMTDREWQLSKSRIDKGMKEGEELCFDSTALAFILVPFESHYMLYYLGAGDSYGMQIKNCNTPHRLNKIDFQNVSYPVMEVREIYQASSNVSVISNRAKKFDLPNLGSKVVSKGDVLILASDGVEFKYESNEFLPEGFTFQKYLTKYAKGKTFAKEWHTHQKDAGGIYDDFALISIYVNSKPYRASKVRKTHFS